MKKKKTFLEIKRRCRNNIKRIRICIIKKLTGVELRQQEQRTRKLITMHKALHHEITYAYTICEEKREEEEP